MHLISPHRQTPALALLAAVDAHADTGPAADCRPHTDVWGSGRLCAGLPFCVLQAQARTGTPCRVDFVQLTLATRFRYIVAFHATTLHLQPSRQHFRHVTPWRPRRILVLSASRVALYSVPSFRSVGVGSALVLERAAEPGWRGALADLGRVGIGRWAARVVRPGVCVTSSVAVRQTSTPTSKQAVLCSMFVPQQWRLQAF